MYSGSKLISNMLKAGAVKKFELAESAFEQHNG